MTTIHTIGIKKVWKETKELYYEKLIASIQETKGQSSDRGPEALLCARISFPVKEKVSTYIISRDIGNLTGRTIILLEEMN